MGNTVLVVDRSEDFIELMEMVLGQDGYIVISCSDPASGLENALRFRPQVALIDLAMPGQGGWDLIARLRADQSLSNMDIIVCSAAKPQVDKRANLIRQLRLHVLPKPFDLSELRQMLNSLPARCRKH